MNLKKEFKKEEIEQLQVAGIKVEDREYRKEEIRKCERDAVHRTVSGSAGKGLPWRGFRPVAGSARPDRFHESNPFQPAAPFGNPYGNRE